MATLDELRGLIFPSRKAAVEELKRNAFPEKSGTYEVREFAKGDWRIMPPRDTVLDAPKKARKEHPADIRDRARIPEAVEFEIHFRVSPTKKIDRKAKTLDEARGIAAELNAEHRASGRRAGIYARMADKDAAPVMVPDDYVPPGGPPVPIPPRFLKRLQSPPTEEIDKPLEAEKAGTEVLVPETTIEAVSDAPQRPPGTDLTALKEADGPWLLVIPGARQNSVVAHALEISQAVKLPVSIVKDKGAGLEVERVIDQAAVKALRKSPGRKGPARRGVATGGREDSKMGRAIALWSRPDGAKNAEIEKATGWTNLGKRYINLASRKTGKKIREIGDKHYALR